MTALLIALESDDPRGNRSLEPSRPVPACRPLWVASGLYLLILQVH